MAITTSANYNKIIALTSGKKFHSGAHVDFANGKSLELDDRNIMEGYPSVQDTVSEENKLELGGAYSSLLTLKLSNFNNEFAPYDFKGAVIKPWIGLTTLVHWRDGENVEKIPLGIFNVSQSPETGSTISVTGYDNLIKLDTTYATKSKLVYPATLAQIVADACSICGVTLATPTFPNNTYSVKAKPSTDTTTCREIVKYAAELAGCFAKCNREGNVEIRWYAKPSNIFDIGKNASSYNVATTDTKITGVQIEGNDDAKTVYTAGINDYAIRIKDNPLAQDGLQNLVNALGTQLIGKQFRSYSVSAMMNPAIETGDIVNLTDQKGALHETIVSGLQVAYGDTEDFSGDAESTDENQSDRFTAADKAQETADNAQTSADQANKGVDEAKTEITQLNGQIVLKADKGNLVAEINISPETIKISADKLELSGLVTISGVKDGTTIIDGACIKTGKIVSSDSNSSFSVDLETGEIAMKKGTFGGTVEWLDGNGNVAGQIFWTNDGGLRIETSSSDITINGRAVAVPGTFGAKSISVGYGGLSVDEDGPVSFGDRSAISGSFGAVDEHGIKRILKFHKGLIYAVEEG